MPNTDLRLYVDSNFASPYALSAFVALKEKGLDFELIPLDLAAGGSQTPGYASASLTRRVPMLAHGDFCLSESSAITEYIDATFPGTPLYPEAPQTRARARQVQAWLRSDLMPIREERTTEVIFFAPNPTPLSSAARSAAEKLFAAVESLLPTGAAHLFGAWSIADTDLALMLNRLIINGDPVPERLVEYARHQWNRPTVQAWCGLQRPAR